MARLDYRVYIGPDNYYAFFTLFFIIIIPSYNNYSLDTYS